MTVQLISSEGRSFHVEAEVAEISGLVNAILIDENAEQVVDEIHLRIGSAVLERVITFCQLQREEPMNEIGVPIPSVNMGDMVQARYVNFLNGLGVELLGELCEAANFMAVPQLLDLTCAKMTSMMKGRTPNEIRETLRIENMALEEGAGEEEDVVTLVRQLARMFPSMPAEIIQKILNSADITVGHVVAQRRALHHGRNFDGTEYLRAVIHQRPNFSLQTIEVTVRSKDQGWGNVGWSWMEYCVGSRNEYGARVLNNGRTRDFVRTVWEFSQADMEFQKVLEYMENHNGTAPVILVACSAFPGFRCVIEEAAVRCRYSPYVEEII